jgi:hypothetical protein
MLGYWKNYGRRLWRAAKLDASLYEEVEADTTAIHQALLTVLLSSLAPALLKLGQGWQPVLTHLLISVVSWFVWAGVTYWVGTKLLPETETRSNIGELMRCMGFSAAPGMLPLLGFGFPVFQSLLWLVSILWMLGAFSLAAQRALDYRSFPRAVLVSMIGWTTTLILRLMIEWSVESFIL